MPEYLSRRERQAKQGKRIQNLSGSLRAYLPDDWIESAGGIAIRVAAFPPSGHGLVYDSTGPVSGHGQGLSESSGRSGDNTAGCGKYSAQALSDLYFQRWDIEMDFRHLKFTMQMDVLRGHSPEVVEKEFWAHVLAYNLLRSLMWDSGERYGTLPGKLSLKGAIQHLLPHWRPCRCTQLAKEFEDLERFNQSFRIARTLRCFSLSAHFLRK